MSLSSSRRKRLEAQWEASFAEVQRLEAHYRRGIDQLERFTLSDLTVSGCTQWFRLYLRVVDLNVQIRRGELRHRTARTPRFPRAHTTTGVPDAVYSGLSIDDANAVFKQLEDSGKVRQSKLELMSFKMDPFDTDVIQLLDERLTKCREQFLALRSRYYGRIELNGIDPHEQLVVLSSTTRPQRVEFAKDEHLLVGGLLRAPICNEGLIILMHGRVVPTRRRWRSTLSALALIATNPESNRDTSPSGTVTRASGDGDEMGGALSNQEEWWQPIEPLRMIQWALPIVNAQVRRMEATIHVE